MELLISAGLVIAFCVVLFWLTRKIPDSTLQTIAQMIVVLGGAVWLLTHFREIVHAIASCC